MTELFLKEAVGQVPALVVLTVLVLVFVKDRAASLDQLSKTVNAFQRQVSQLFDSATTNAATCREIQNGTKQAMHETAQVVRELLIELKRDRENRQCKVRIA